VQEQSILKGPHRLVVGGGIGAGKSMVTSLLAKRGVVVVEADAVGHSVIAPGGRAHEAVCGRWPDAVAEGIIDRAALAAIVFNDPRELRALESITHPAIADEIEARAGAAGLAPVVVEVPVTAPVVGHGWTRVWVDAPVALRVARAVGRGMDHDDVQRRIANQASDAEWAAWADHRLVNDGTLADLEVAVGALIEMLTPAGGGESNDTES
jgi:dephospho-CoA kinase